MKLARYTIPLGIGLFCAGIFMFLSAKATNSNNLGIDFGQPKHPITKEMIRSANEMARKPAAAFQKTDVKGQPASISGKDLPRPQFVLFILDGCPCSIDAQPLFNTFSKHWAGKVDFVGVINDDVKKGRMWVSDYRPAFPVIPDPDKEIINAYKARQSVYCALISREGEIVEMWPGYSRDMMKEMNDAIAKEVGVEAKAFNAQYAPKEKTSGCYF